MNGKTNTRRIRLGAGALAILVALSGGLYFGTQGASAQGPGGPRGRLGGPGGPGGFGRGGPGGPGALGPMMLGRLNLTDAQRDQVTQILESHRDEQRALGERERAARMALDTAVNADAFDESTVRTRAADVAAVDADAAVMRARIYSEVLNILTSEQLSELKKTRAEMRERMEKAQAGRPQRPRPQ
jgi:Spy/CpxP family protein refolding chaperone